MTRLLVQISSEPLTIDFPSIVSMTEQQFYEFCLANRGLRIERTAKGEVIIMPPAFSDTGNRNFNLAAQLWKWTEQDGTGLGFDSSSGFTLPNGAIRSPDVAWIKLTKWNQLTDKQKASFAPICPDFVVELRSSSDTLSSLQKKMDEYIANGTRLAWLIDRQNHQVYVYRPHQDPEILDNPLTVSAEPELIGFELTMEKIW
ncbi:Uma2 family endonuclease [Synechocystis salina LEGE 06155]|nr:Uma2 family endonuclease [Synechocystis salina LEGE 06155]